MAAAKSEGSARRLRRRARLLTGLGAGLGLWLGPSPRASASDGLESAPAAAVEHDAPEARHTAPGERLSLALSTRVGGARAPFVTAALPEVSGFAMTLRGAAAVALGARDRLHLSAPVAVAWLDFPAGAMVTETVLGNLELGLEHRERLGARTRLGLRAAWLAPTAGHGPEASLLDNRALALASALSGGRDAAAWTPGVSGARLAARVERSVPRLELRAGLESALLVRLSEASLPDATPTHAIGALAALDLGARWSLTPALAATLGACFIAQPAPVHELARDRERERWLQAVLEPGLELALGSARALGLDGSVPVGGTLGGDAWSIRVSVRQGL